MRDHRVQVRRNVGRGVQGYRGPTVSISCCDIRGRAESHGWRSYPATAAPYRDYNASERLTFLRIDRLQMSNAGTETSCVDMFFRRFIRVKSGGGLWQPCNKPLSLTSFSEILDGEIDLPMAGKFAFPGAFRSLWIRSCHAIWVRAHVWLYVSRRWLLIVPVRFNCPPEITLHRLRPANGAGQ